MLKSVSEMRIKVLFLAILIFFLVSFLLCLYLSNAFLSYEQPFHHEVTDKQTLMNVFQAGEVMAIRRNSFSKTRNKLVNLACVSELFVAEGVNAGLAAILLATLDHVNLCVNLGAIPVVYWRLCGTVCPKDPKINAWEMYFKPVNPNIEDQARRVLCLGSITGPDRISIEALNNKTEWKSHRKENLINLSFRPRQLDGFLEEGIITHDTKLKAHELILKYVQVQPKIQGIVGQFFSRRLAKYNVLAVHIRGTDHDSETDSGRLRPLSAFIENTKEILAKNPSINKIFIASDNLEGIETFVKEFGNKVAYTKAIRSIKYKGPPVHDSGKDPFKIGSQVLVDILLMAKCKYFLHAESSVAALVTYFNPNIEAHYVENPSSMKEASNGDASMSRTPVTQTLNKDSSKLGSKSKNPISKRYQYNVIADREEIDEVYSTFIKNRQYSVCPNFSKGIFISFKEVMTMTSRTAPDL